MKRRWPLRRGDFALAHARRAAFRQLLTDGGFGDHAMHEVVFGELITNAARYGSEPMYVQVSIARRTLKIDVVDSGDCFDLRMKLLQEPRSEGGRGLHIVKSLTSKFTLGKTRDFHCQLSAVVAL